MHIYSRKIGQGYSKVTLQAQHYKNSHVGLNFGIKVCPRVLFVCLFACLLFVCLYFVLFVCFVLFCFLNLLLLSFLY